MVETWTIKQLNEYVGGLSNPSKMPGYGYSLPARECKTGSKLRQVKGSTCSGCYAMKGRYVFPKVQEALYRRLEAITKDLWVDVMAELVSRRSENVPYFRWHDSGDLQNVDHLNNIIKIAEMTPDVAHWLPTREYRIVKEWLDKYGRKSVPKNLTIRLSAHMIGGKFPEYGKPLTVSTVSRAISDYPKAWHCPAPSQGNSCGDCRACWDEKVKHVDYHLH